MQPAFRVLGDVEVRDPTGRALPLKRRKLRALLAFLIVRAGRPVSSDRIIDALWGERPPPSARANLHSYIRGLREVLARAAPGGGAELSTTTAGYRLDLPAGQCDADLFATLVVDGRAASAEGRYADAVDVLGRALGLWRGRALADLADSGWAVPYAAWLEEARLTALEDREEARFHLGQHTELADRLARLTADHPLRERLWHLYLLVLHRLGRRAEALAAYERARDTLTAEVGAEPGPRLRQLAEQVRADGGAPTRPVPALLPPDVADFTGRTAETADIVAHLTGRGSGLRIAGITGMAGVGKTTLAVHVAHRIAGEFPDGQLYVNLRGAEAGRSDPAEVLGRFLRALGVDSRAVPDTVVERGELYRTLLAGRRVLVLLDNAADAAQVRPLLPGAATCAVVVTGRSRPAALEGARWTDLPVFAPDEATLLLDRVVSDRRVSEQPDDAAAIVRLCGGLPLAIRIAGARLGARGGLPLRHLVGLLRSERHRLDQLSVGDLEVSASLALSYEGLDAGARRLFRRLGRFDVPDFPAWLADAVDGAPAELDALVDAQLLTVAGTDALGQARYRFHDLVRLYARSREEDTARALRDGFGAYLAIAERMAAVVPGICFARVPGAAHRRPMDLQRHGLAATDPAAWFDAERPSLEAVVVQACAEGLDELAFDLAACLEPAADLRGLYADWERLNRHVMAACQRAGNLRGEAVMLRGLIDVTTWAGSDSGTDAMRRQLADATRLLDMFTRLDERAGMSDAAVMKAWALTAQARWEPAIEYASRALGWAEEAGHTGGRARAHVALAVALGESLRVEEALAHLDRALSAARQHGNPRYEATVLQFQGIAYGRIGMDEESEASLNKSLTLSRRYGDRYPEVLSMLTLGRLYLRRGDVRARPTVTAALAVAREYRMAHHTADALGLLGEIDLVAGDIPAAVRHLRESVARWRTRGWLSYQAAALTTLGSALSEVDPVAAREAFEEARQLFERIGDTGRAAELNDLLASV
ncbi:AfsR/SARP family transcriptional regulator [Virgisporangium ochraceum]|uniref:SARP family transcriptional regulator n=1 Tax=Virgisporangium ochraceum TaxID=65505 RepID=A0A8J4A0M6_9ACTN|nr:BTAD domain-containing putative transcriptional regulator [Virgisporangium ochraceum]GIJ71925.1 SARP family transcriptional regulator [Virgisporangium ochraceum]